jgi:hypothetical protein
MMSKKVIGLLTVAVFLFSFAMAANAAFPDPTSEGAYPTVNGKQADNYFQLNECLNCTKCPVKNVPCPKTTTTVGDQGSVSTSITPTCPFDYDNGVNNTITGDYGYCTPAASTTNCKVILNICSCPDACNTNVGTKIGIQMEILTPGVYWAYDPKAYDSDNDYATVWFENYAPNSTTYCGGKTQSKNFGRIRYYLSSTQTFNPKGKYVRNAKDERSPVGDGSTYYGQTNTAGDCFTTIPATNQVKVIESDIATDYIVTAADAAKCMFWIDVPAMRIDGTAKAGDAIQVRITLLWNRTVDSLCQDCSAPILCECIRTVGIVCCDEASSSSGCVFFPYVLQGLESTSGWVTGIAISARVDKMPADAYCELTLRDSEGTTATYKKTDMGSKLVWAFVLDREMKNFNKTLAAGAVSLEVKSNYRIDGYAFMNANMAFGAGEMARACGTACNP